MRTIDAIQEALGLEYRTLEDAIGWYSTPDARYGWGAICKDLRAKQTVFNKGFNGWEMNQMVQELLQAAREMGVGDFTEISDALKHHSRSELLDAWLQYEGLLGYTSQILNVMEELGYDISCEE